MAKPGRNDLCDCGSGKKFKRCHGVQTDSGGRKSTVLMVIVGGAVLAALAAGVASFTAGGGSGTRVWDPVHGHYHDANGIQVP
jgi:hypothetical protein